MNPVIQTGAQVNELLARDVAEEIDGTGVAAEGKVIFEGNIVPRNEVARIMDERLLEGRKSALFDPQDVIDDHLPCNQVRLRLRTNMVWSLSYRAVGAIRDVLFRMQEQARETGTINGWNEFFAQLSEAKASADYAEQMGYAEFGSGISKARATLSLLATWRELAIRDAKQLRAKLDLPEMYDLVSEPPRYDPSEAEKMTLVTRLMLEGESVETIQEAVKLAVEKVQAEHKQKVLNTVQLAPHMERLLTECLAGLPDVTFPDMPIDVQGKLTASLLTSVEKLPQQLTKMKSVSTMDMVVAFPMLKRLGASLRDTLADPRFEVEV